MADEFKHKDVGVGLTEAEYDAVGGHEFDSQASGDILYASSATQLSRLAKGTDGDFLSSGTPPSWVTHATDLDAHTYNIFERIHIEHYLSSPLIVTIGTTAVVADVLYAFPYPITIARTTSHIGIQVAVGDAGKVARLGLYTDTGACYPGDLIADSGEFSVADVELSTNAYVQTLVAGLYWIVFLSNGVPSVGRAADCLIITDRDGNYPSGYGGIGKTASAYGALSPTYDPFPAGATIQYKGTGGLLRFSA